ncbi:GNAT family N-acetyltransferase [Micrococcus terreus]|uniref:bifunctional acetate--CoA ligase family protein/GNAT family N-acetyltransferase n=1 Tax=Micrococcus terreus TaxID=574650 RepID=UPI00254CFA0A|nr:GNAT family N-acetyltransferase [Micrococcus terreus]MDK7700204.1 GNAT family N-acetyltransferase [Micrococcus terreus]WOO98470.1 GNAT family N-acetyltransferase [Micrococcus terreus]
MGESTRTSEYPAHWEADVVLRDGSTAHLRPIRPDDAEELARMHRQQSQTSIYLRFFTYKSSLSSKELQRFTQVDHRDRVALIVLRGGEIIGVGRYDRLDDPLEAEVAFNIADSQQGRGLGSILMEHLAVAARENGIRRFSAEVLPENRKMLSVFQESGFEISRRFDDGVVAVEFSIDPTAKVRAVMESREHRAEAKSVSELLAPESVAVIGASREWGSVGYALLENLIEGGFTGPVYGINRDALELAGMISRASLDEVPGEVELAVVAVPVDEIPQVIQDCARKGVKGMLVVTTGFADAGPEGLARQRELVREARANGMRVIGPASAGLVNTDPAVSLNASVAPFLPLRGSVGLFSQSAAVGATLFAAAHRRGIGVSSMVSAGNRADVSGNDAMQYFEDDDSTTAVGVYLESFGNPRKFSRIARRLSRTKPVVVARSDVMGRRLPPGHETRTTQAPAGAVDSMLEQTGVIQVDNHDALMDLIQAVSCQPLPRGRRVGVVGNSPALNRVVADAAERHGLTVVQTVEVEGLDAEHTTSDAEAALDRAVRSAVAQSDESSVDALLVVTQAGMQQNPGDAVELARCVEQAARDSQIPVLASFTGVLDPTFQSATVVGAGPAEQPGGLQRGLPVFSSPEQAARVLSQLVDYVTWRSAEAGVPAEPTGIDRRRAEDLIQGWAGRADGAELVRLSAQETEELLACYGISVLPSARFTSADEAVAAADRLGWPVAVKAVDSYVRHRLDLGGVRLNIVDADSLRRNVEQMRQVLEPYGNPDLEVQSMAPSGQGCTITALEDPLLGPVVSFGIAGDAVDLLDDWVHRVPPLNDQDIQRMVRAPRAAAKLFGHGGLPDVDTAALEDLLARTAALKDDHPQVARIRFNPVLASAQGVTVLSAEIDVANAAQRTDSARRAMRD